MDSAWQPTGGFQADLAPVENGVTSRSHTPEEQLVPSFQVRLFIAWLINSKPHLCAELHLRLQCDPPGLFTFHGFLEKYH